MNDTARRGLLRLRDPDRRAVRELAALLVAEALDTSVAEVARPTWIASQLAASLEAATRGDLLARWIERRLAAEGDRWRGAAEPLREQVPAEVERTLRALLARPYSPDQQMVFRIVDQPAVRSLVKLVLTDTVTRFRRRAVEWDAGFLGGLGARAAARGRGLVGNVSKNLGGLVDAVRGEVDQAVERRVNEFVHAATTEAIALIAGYAADPAHADQIGQIRVALLDLVLDLPMSDLVREAEKLDPAGAIEVVAAALRAVVAERDFVARAEVRIGALLREAGDGTFGAWLDEIGLRAVWSASTVELLEERLGAVVAAPAFEAWWEGLFAEETRGDA